MTMLKKNFFSAAEAYAAPVCETLDVNVEGSLCGLTSSTSEPAGSHEEWSGKDGWN